MKRVLALLCLSSAPALAAPNPADFHRALYALHEQQLAGRAVRTEQEMGNYEGAAAARYRYVDTRYFDAATGALLSRVRRDAAAPEFVHIVEVNVYEQGRLTRDFGSITLPWAPLHPVRTMINLHHYNGGLHSFRQHDFFGQVAYEFCEGDLSGKRVRISLDGSDINDQATATAAYQACFGGMGREWAQYTTPH
jgi:hypothetical protein